MKLTTTQKVLLVVMIGSTIPVFRSGARSHLTFWEWVWNHTIFGPPIEYVPEEDYQKALCPASITRKVDSGVVSPPTQYLPEVVKLI